MKIVFAGTPPFAAAALRALHRAGHDLPLVLTQPDRPAGRGQKSAMSAVAQEAADLDLRIEKPPTLRSVEAQDMLRAVKPDVMVVAAYGLLLPQAVLDIPTQGCINIHGSLLPRWRGAAPVQRAIEAGDTETGIAIMRMDAGLDTGPVLLERSLAIAADETSATLFAKLTALGAKTIVDALGRLSSLSPVTQPSDGVTYARKIEKAEARIDWTRPAIEIERRLRAFDPFPGSETRLDGQPLKIWRGEVVASQTMDAPGTVILVSDGAMVVRCGEQALKLSSVQKPGGKRLPIAEFLRGATVARGTLLQS